MPFAVTDPALTHDLGPIQLVFVTLVAAIGLTYLARRLRIADPILLLLGGIVLSQLPDLPDIVLAPDIVFLLFLPPILFGAAYFTPIRDFRANLRPILLLAIGLVLFTTVVVAFVAQQLTGMPVAAAVALGAIVAPPDAVAATAIFRRLGVPRRIVTILEGESLLNDASALIIVSGRRGRRGRLGNGRLLAQQRGRRLRRRGCRLRRRRGRRHGHRSDRRQRSSPGPCTGPRIR